MASQEAEKKRKDTVNALTMLSDMLMSMGVSGNRHHD
jgi:hypothetical protein